MISPTMLVLVTISAILLFLTYTIQLTLVQGCIKYMVKVAKKGGLGTSQFRDSKTLSVVLLLVLTAQLLQITLWAVAFMWIGEFDQFSNAFYHSAVNFASLGYGDIVMIEEWRLLGALEAAAGLMMFGVSTALLFAIISTVFRIQIRQIDPTPQEGDKK